MVRSELEVSSPGNSRKHPCRHGLSGSKAFSKVADKLEVESPGLTGDGRVSVILESQSPTQWNAEGGF